MKNFKRQSSEEDNGLDDELLTSHRHARETMNKRARRYLEQNKTKTTNNKTRLKPQQKKGEEKKQKIM